jgi:hypothetical protein
MRIRPIVTLMGLAFAVTLAVVIGLRLSTEAMAVIVGVVAGVAASIPTSLIVVWLTMRKAACAPVREEPRIIPYRVNATPPPAWPDAMSSPTHLPTLTTPYRAPWSPRHFTGLGGPETASIPAEMPTRASVPGVSVIGGPE